MGSKRSAVLVLGMHRSGTSSVAAALPVLGFELGHSLLPPNDENPKGFFENRKIVQLNDDLLRHLNLAWDSLGFVWRVDFQSNEFEPFVTRAREVLSGEFAGADRIAIKDPRLCIVVPFWQRVFETMSEWTLRYVVVIRNPMECARSQRRRHLADPDFHVIGGQEEPVLLLWYTYMRKAITAIGSDSFMILHFEKVISDPRGTLKRLASFLDADANPDAVENYAEEFIVRHLKRSHVDSGELEAREPAGGFVSKLYAGLCELAEEDSPATDRLPALLESTPSFEELCPVFEKASVRLHGIAYDTALSLRHRLISVIQELGEAQAQAAEARTLREKLELLSDDHRQLLNHHEDLIRNHHQLQQHHKALIESYRAIIHSRSWRWTRFIRKFRSGRLIAFLRR
jgi:hypothetical protein